MPLTIPSKFANRTGSIQLAEIDDNFQSLANELDRIATALTVSGTAVTFNGNLNITGTPTGPTPVSTTNNTQLATTAFVKTVIASSVSSAIPTGVIAMWSGSIATIPSGWYLCNGTNGTPDLRDRFIVGAGNTYTPSGTGGSADAIVPSHSHTASSSTTTSITDLGHKHNDRMSIGHDDNNGTNGQDASINLRQSADAPTLSYYGTNETATTGILASSSTSTTVNAAGVSATNANLPPYYALAYIMKA